LPAVEKRDRLEPHLARDEIADVAMRPIGLLEARVDRDRAARREERSHDEPAALELRHPKGLAPRLEPRDARALVVHLEHEPVVARKIVRDPEKPIGRDERVMLRRREHGEPVLILNHERSRALPLHERRHDVHVLAQQEVPAEFTHQ
jgi:hypothetical protein